MIRVRLQEMFASPKRRQLPRAGPSSALNCCRRGKAAGCYEVLETFLDQLLPGVRAECGGDTRSIPGRKTRSPRHR